jgi:hypothetical protein
MGKFTESTREIGETRKNQTQLVILAAPQER